jgi:hypothetical protein
LSREDDSGIAKIFIFPGKMPPMKEGEKHGKSIDHRFFLSFLYLFLSLNVLYEEKG